MVLTCSVEFYLALHQAMSDVMNGLFPITYKEAVYLAALRAQHDLGPFSRLQLGQGKYKVSMLHTKLTSSGLLTISSPKRFAMILKLRTTSLSSTSG